MNARKVSIVAATCFLLTVLQLLAALTIPVAAIVAAVAVALLGFGMFRLFDVELERAWSPVAIVSGSSLAGIAIRFLGNMATFEWTLWLAPTVAAVTAGMVILLRSSGSRRCGLCNRRLGRDLAFDCPRCGLLVCDHTCWIFEHSRCRLCDENRVPIFPPDGRWWDRRFGPRMRQGRCQLCLADAAEADLRACAKCGRAQCRPCWDFANGQCSRCQWVVDELPESLQIYMFPGEQAERPRSAARRAPQR